MDICRGAHGCVQSGKNCDAHENGRSAFHKKTLKCCSWHTIQGCGASLPRKGDKLVSSSIQTDRARFWRHFYGASQPLLPQNFPGNTVGAVVPTAPAFRLADCHRRSGFSPCPEVFAGAKVRIFAGIPHNSVQWQKTPMQLCFLMCKRLYLQFGIRALDEADRFRIKFFADYGRDVIPYWNTELFGDS